MESVARVRPENIVHALGMHLRVARKAAGATQAQLAESLNVTEGLISKFETGCRGKSYSAPG